MNMILWLLVILQSSFFLEGKVLRSSINDGSYCNIKQYPHIVQIRHGSAGAVCGGSILDATTILTAAHCITNMNGAERGYSVVAGVTNISDPNAKPVRVKKCIRRNKNETQIDIIILKLEPELLLNNATIKKISLNTEPLKTGKVCVASGWGLTDKDGNGTQSNNLRHVNLTIGEKRICEANYRTDFVKSCHLCTCGGSKGVCRGDSGGPLVCDGKLAGIVSFGVPCAKGFPDVFVDVAAPEVRRWIEANRK